MIQFDEHFFQMGWFNHQLDKLGKLLNFPGTKTGTLGFYGKGPRKNRFQGWINHLFSGATAVNLVSSSNLLPLVFCRNL